MGQLIPFKIDKTRALVQATASFGSLPVVIWEYVVNGLAYQIKGKMPCVEVTIKKDSIEVTDNGRGMDQDDLANFFTGYAENKDRKEGNYVFINRGYFGTGGFSIFKVAKNLQITSVKDKRLYDGNTSFDDLKKDTGFRLDKIGAKTDIPNGTKFVATDLNKEISDKDILFVKDYIRKQMMRYKGTQVYINNDLLEYKEPSIEEDLTKSITSKGTEFFDNLNKLGFGAGEVQLTLKKSKKPLKKGEYGVSVLGDGNLLEVCTPGIETKKYVNYILGEAEIRGIYQKLEEFDPPIFDQSRRMELSLDNKYVVVLRNFIASELIKFEQEVSKIEKEREKNKFNKELDSKLDKISGKASEILKDEWERLDLNSQNNQNLPKKSKKESNLQDVIGKVLNAGEEFYKNNKDKKDSDKNLKSKPPSDIKSKNNSKLKDEKIKNKNLGGLRIRQKALGEEELRAEFYPDQATIYINTDFPPLKRFIEKRDYENDQFNSLLKEIIATELAVAITAINIQKDTYGNDMTTAMYDLRARINDFSGKFDKL